MKEKIEEYIRGLAAEKNITVSNTTDLFQTGILDSFGIVSLLSYIIDTFSLRLETESFDADSFRTIDSIVKFLKKIT